MPHSKFCLWYPAALVVHLQQPGSLRTEIAPRLSTLWLLAKFPLPSTLHGDRKELMLISPVSYPIRCTIRSCQKDTIEARSSSSSLRCTNLLSLHIASGSFLQHQPRPAIHPSPKVQTQWPQEITQHTYLSWLQSTGQVTECLWTVFQSSQRNKSRHLHLNKLCCPFSMSRYLPVHSVTWYLLAGTQANTWDFPMVNLNLANCNLTYYTNKLQPNLIPTRLFLCVIFFCHLCILSALLFLGCALRTLLINRTS